MILSRHAQVYTNATDRNQNNKSIFQGCLLSSSRDAESNLLQREEINDLDATVLKAAEYCAVRLIKYVKKIEPYVKILKVDNLCLEYGASSIR